MRFGFLVLSSRIRNCKYLRILCTGRPEKIENFSGAMALDRQGSVKWLAGLKCSRLLTYLGK